MNKKQLIQAFLDAVNTWKRYCVLLRTANKQNHNKAKAIYGKAVFYWIKQAEYLKKQLDIILGLRVA